MHFMQDLKSFSEQVSKDNDLAGLTIQIVDRTVSGHGIRQVLDCMVPQEAPWRYREEQLYLEDPFTEIELNEAPDVACTEDLIRFDDPRIAALRPRCPHYWDFIERYDLSVEGVSTRRLRKGVYLVAGFLRDRRRVYPSPPAWTALNHASYMLHNLVSSEVLLQTMQTNAGQLALHSVLVPANVTRSAERLELLSARELEVARLISVGRQTKQVAYDLGVSQHTVENHLRRIYAKLAVHNRAALASLIH